jgi:hypothetical protein
MDNYFCYTVSIERFFVKFIFFLTMRAFIFYYNKLIYLVNESIGLVCRLDWRMDTPSIYPPCEQQVLRMEINCIGDEITVGITNPEVRKRPSPGLPARSHQHGSKGRGPDDAIWTASPYRLTLYFRR